MKTITLDSFYKYIGESTGSGIESEKVDKVVANPYLQVRVLPYEPVFEIAFQPPIPCSYSRLR